MKTFFCFVLFAVHSVVSTTPLNAAQEGLAFTAQPHKQLLFLGEPLFMDVALTNTGRAPVEIFPFVEAFRILLGPSGTELQPYHTKPEMSVKSRARGEALNPNESFRMRLPILLKESAMMPGTARSNQSHLVFSEPGTYDVQVRYGKLPSAINVITVTEIVSTEREAGDFIRTNHAVALTIQLPENRLNTNLIGDVARLLAANPTSAYRGYLEMLLPKPNDAKTNPLPTRLQQVTAELAALRYDIRAFQIDYPQAAREYLEKLMLLNDQKGGGGITQSEFDARCADLLREYITKYASALSPEEWNRRSEEYARQDDERRRIESQRSPQDEAQQKRLIELLERPEKASPQPK